MKTRYTFPLLTLLFLLVSTIAKAERIEQVKFRHNQRIPTSTLGYYLKGFVGKEYSEETESEMLAKLYDLGLFGQIATYKDGKIIWIDVTEVPLIADVGFEGNTKLKTKHITKVITSQAGSSLEPTSLVTDLKIIKEMYARSGRFYNEVKPVLNPQGSTHTQVIFKIKEGPTIGVKNIYFNGLESTPVTRGKLKSLISTKDNRLFYKIMGGSSYNPSNFATDVNQIQAYLASKGFADAEVKWPVSQLSDDGSYVNVVFDVRPGSKYKFNKLTLKNPTGIYVNVDPKWIKTNSTFSLAKVDAISSHISKTLANNGYPEVTIRPEFKKDIEKKIIDVRLVVDNASKYYVDNVVVVNNLKTKSSVILKKLRITEGDVFNQRKIEKGVRNLYECGFFNNVKPRVIPKEDGKLDIVMEVEEKSTTKIHLSGEWSSKGGGKPSGKIFVGDSNVLGSGNSVSLGVGLSLDGGGDIQLDTNIPNALGSDVDVFAGITGTHSNANRGGAINKLLGIPDEGYDKRSFRINVGGAFTWSDHLSQIVQYTFKNEDLSLGKDDKKTAAKKGDIISAREVGNFVTSAISNKFVVDLTPDRPYQDSNSSIIISSEIAGLGGDVRFIKGELEYKFVTQLSGDSLIRFKAKGGMIRSLEGYNLKTDERFGLGDVSLRGFASSGVGPRIDLSKLEIEEHKKAKPDEGRALNGENYYVLSAQYERPLIGDELIRTKMVLFSDLGSTFGVSDDYYKNKYNETKGPVLSIGAGLLIENDLLSGPIFLGVSMPLVANPEDKKQSFQYSWNFYF